MSEADPKAQTPPQTPVDDRLDKLAPQVSQLRKEIATLQELVLRIERETSDLKAKLTPSKPGLFKPGLFKDRSKSSN